MTGLSLSRWSCSRGRENVSLSAFALIPRYLLRDSGD